MCHSRRKYITITLGRLHIKGWYAVYSRPLVGDLGRTKGLDDLVGCESILRRDFLVILVCSGDVENKDSKLTVQHESRHSDKFSMGMSTRFCFCINYRQLL